MSFLKDHLEGTLLFVHAQPRASRDAIVGKHGDALKIAVRSAPVDSAANEAIRSLIAKALGVADFRVELRKGATSRKKTFQLLGIDAKEARRLLEAKIP